jgi:Xaa-Pro aminopeptidase
MPDHLAARVRTLRRRLDEADADAMLITHAPDIRYLTDFPGHDSWLVVSARTVMLISDFRFSEQIDNARPFVRKVIRTGPMAEALAEAIGDLSVKTLAFQAEHMTVHARGKLGDKLKGITLKPTSDWLITQRAVKDKTELRQIRRALALQEQAYAQTLDQIRPGMSESELVTLIEYNMRWIGGEGPSFNTIVAIGSNGSLPHHEPGRTRVKANTPILIDFGTKANGYCSDLTRVVTMGGFSQKITDMYRIVAEAQQAAIDAIAPGKTGVEIDRVARTIIEDAGYGDHFGHGLGHGIGLEIHERPVLSTRSTDTLEDGHVVTVEPGIYLPGIGGVRIEDDVLVTARGHRKLSTLPTAMESVVI